MSSSKGSCHVNKKTKISTQNHLPIFGFTSNKPKTTDGFVKRKITQKPKPDNIGQQTLAVATPPDTHGKRKHNGAVITTSTSTSTKNSVPGGGGGGDKETKTKTKTTKAKTDEAPPKLIQLSSLPPPEKSKNTIEVKDNAKALTERINPSVYSVKDHEPTTLENLSRMAPCFRPPLAPQTSRDLELMIRDIYIHKRQLWIFGTTPHGNSVSLRADFNPWFFIECPETWTNEHLSALRDTLNTNPDYKQKYEKTGVMSIEFEMRQNLIGFNFEKKTRVARVKLHSQWSYAHYLRLFKEQSIAVDGADEDVKFVLYNEDVSLIVQFLASVDAAMYGWIAIQRTNLRPLAISSSSSSRGNNNTNNSTRSQLNYSCAASNIRPVKDRQEIATLYRIPFDIETVSAGTHGHNPRAKNQGDMVTCISSWVFNSASTEPLGLVMFCLGDTDIRELQTKPTVTTTTTTTTTTTRTTDQETKRPKDDIGNDTIDAAITRLETHEEACARRGLPPDKTTILRFSSEKTLLQCWRQYVIDQNDADELVTYNGMRYDLPYILERASVLGIEDEMRDLGKFYGDVLETREIRSASAQQGDQCFLYTDIPGRTQFDIMRFVRKQKFSGYSLKEVAKKLLKNQEKKDLPYKLLRPYFMAGSQTRGEVMVYCAYDSLLTYRIAEKQMFFLNHYEMSKLTSTTNMQLLIKGESLKVWTLICDKIERNGWILNKTDLIRLNELYPVKYIGGKVLEPKVGFYSCPVACLDFSSLYPSIMLSIMACYSTLLMDPVVIAEARRQGYVVHEVNIGQRYNPHFVQNVRSLIPGMLREFLDKRKAAQAKEEAEQDPEQRAVYKAKQLALKLTGNATYGFTSAGNDSQSSDDGSSSRKKRRPQRTRKPGEMGGFLTCTAIAAAVTARGREMILETKAELEKMGCVVIYGDTDSCFLILPGSENLKFPVNGDAAAKAEIARYMEKGAAIASKVSARFRAPNKLNFEKLFVRLMLLGKKKYSSHYYEFREIKTVMTVVPSNGPQSRGTEMVRRDWCPQSQITCKDLTDGVLEEKSATELVRIFKNHVDDMRLDRVPLENYKLSRQLRTEYSGDKHIHLHVAHKIAQRNPDRALPPGERVQYIVSDSKEESHLRGEEFDYAVENKVKIDKCYYFEKQLLPPALRLLKNLIPDAEKVLKAAGSDLIRDKTRNHDIRRLFGAPATETETMVLGLNKTI